MTTTRASLRRLAAVHDATGAEIGTAQTIVIERVEPELDGGRYPAKRVQGDWFAVTADIIADGHDQLGAAVLIRAEDESAWEEIPMRPGRHDRWTGRVRVRRNCRHLYTIEAWRDEVGELVGSAQPQGPRAVGHRDRAGGGPPAAGCGRAAGPTGRSAG